MAYPIYDNPPHQAVRKDGNGVRVGADNSRFNRYPVLHMQSPCFVVVQY